MRREKDKQEGISRYDSLVHVGGLTAPKNCKASVILSPTELTINCGGSKYVLNIAKIRNVDFQLNNRFHRRYRVEFFQDFRYRRKEEQ